MPELLTLPTVILGFNTAVSAVEAFAAQISSAADKYDKESMSKLAHDMGYVFDHDKAELEKELIQILEESDLEIESLPDEERLAQIKSLQGEFSAGLQKLAQTDFEKARRFAFAWQAFMKQPPVEGRLLRRSALIMIVAYFEQMLANLIRTYYTQHPTELPPDRQLSLADLHSIGSVSEAQEYLIAREADHVLHGGLDGHLHYFRTSLKVAIKDLAAPLDELREVFLRRNLIVHANGRVNKNYLAKAGEAYLKDKQIQEGMYLHPSTYYLRRAITVVHISGLALIHQCWRKWASQEREASDRSLTNEIYDALVDEKYDVVEALANFALDFGLPKKLRNYVFINYAIALRDTDRSGEIPAILKKLKPESPPDGKVELSIEMLEGRYEIVLQQLPQALAHGTLDKLARYWPLFKPIREDPRFSDAFDG
jgi:hypothetical protein